jgi:hypothetical protein
MNPRNIINGLIILFFCIQPASAQYAASKQARELLTILQATRLATKTGVSWIEYTIFSSNIKLKLNQFLTAPDAEKHPAGYWLKESAQAYINAHDNTSFRNWNPQSYWHSGRSNLEGAEKCIATNVMCATMDEGFSGAIKNGMDRYFSILENQTTKRSDAGNKVSAVFPSNLNSENGNTNVSFDKNNSLLYRTTKPYPANGWIKILTYDSDSLSGQFFDNISQGRGCQGRVLFTRKDSINFKSRWDVDGAINSSAKCLESGQTYIFDMSISRP